VTGESHMYRSIVLALDGSEAAAMGIPHARALAERGGRITVVHVRELIPGRSSAENVSAPAAERIVREQVEQLAHEGLDVRLRTVSTVSGGAAEAIADVARAEAGDVIVLGTRGHSQVTGMLLGSIGQRLPHVSPCAVLLVPPGLPS
jgi:nucleotide-binding universal stress UspA family protein